MWGICSRSEEASDYDKRHMSLCAWLLHDVSEAASEEDLARVTLGLDPAGRRAVVRDVVQSHLRRAHWIADTLFPLLW